MRRKKSSVVPLAVVVLLLLSALGWYAAADPGPSGPVPAPAAAPPPADERPPENATAQGLDNARVVEAQPRVRRIAMATPPGRGMFQLTLDVPPEAVSRAFLVYELAGVPGWTAASCSINGLPTQGGFGAVPSSGTHLQIEEINPRWLRRGLNQIVFSPSPEAERTPSGMTSLQGNSALAPEGAVPYTVRNLRVVYLDAAARPAPRSLRISHPLQGESDDDGAAIRGFVEPAGLPTGPAELFVDGSYVSEGIGRDGAFAVFVPRSVPPGEAWDVELEVVYPDGIRLQQTVHLKGTSADEGDAAKDGDLAELDAGPATARSLALGKARLNVTPGALDGKVKLSMRGLRHGDLPALDDGMTNVTPERGGFRMGPHGLRFKKPVELSLPYDAALIPKGMTAEDVHTFFFDEESGRWFPLPRLDAKSGGEVITSLTTHFTDFINATIAMPDEPSGANFSSNSLQELAKADPAAGIVQIAPPEGGPTGDALLDFPLVVPPGRHGMQPELAVRYDSSGGDGWLGVGWDLRLPSIEISTLFGVPRYDGSERYLIDGEQLAPTSEPSVFVRRIEGSFERIVRKGSGPADYSWEVTDKKGVRYLYGDTDGSRLHDPDPPSGAASNVFRWYLRQAIDRHGNSVDYTYLTDSGGADSQRWAEVYPQTISYSGGHYRVVFNLDDGNQRPDRLSSGRQGFKTVTRRRLASVDVQADSVLVRRYLFQYEVGDFSKSRLQAITVTGEGGAADFYQHRFTYHSAETGFAEPVPWGSLAATESRSETQSVSVGGHGFVGVGDTACQAHAGAQAGGSSGQEDTRATFLDLDGDGLPDRVAEADGGGTVAYNRYDPTQGSGGFTSAVSLSKAASFEHNQQWSFDLGLGLHALEEQATVGTNWVWSHSNDDQAVADIDGDGLPDLVSSDSVLLNQGGSFGGSRPLTSSGSGFDFSNPLETLQVLQQFKLKDPLRKLVLPFDGTVQITGGIQKKTPGGDGVKVEIHHNDDRLWRRTIAGGDTAVCVPTDGDACGEGLTVAVKKGDGLYFLAGSIFGTAADDLLWAPRVTYTSAVVPGESADPQDVTGRQDEREPYGARRFVFDAQEDFRLAGYRGARWTAPAAGSVHVLGSLTKQATPADVTLTVLQIAIPPVVHSWSFKADQAGSFDVVLPDAITVAPGTVLVFHPGSAAPIDPSLVQWTPQVTYENGLYCRVPPEDPVPVPICGVLTCQTDPVSGQDLCTVAGDPRAGRIPRNAVSQSADAWVDVFPPPWNQPDVLSGGYHGWFYGEWNGDREFHASDLKEPDKGDDDDPPPPPPPFVAARPNPHGAAGPVWEASGFDLYMAAEGVKPSRQGRDAAADLAQANGTPGAPLGLIRKTSGTTVGIEASLGPAGASLSCGASDTQLDLIDLNGDSYPDQVSGDADLTTDLTSCGGLFDASTATGTSTDGKVLLGDGRGGFAAALLPFTGFTGLQSPVRRTADATLSLSAGLSLNYPRKGGKGNSKSIANPMPSVGSSLSYSQTTTDLVDVNGDGLPDRVAMIPGSSAVKVRLNLGYRFGAEETWDLPSWTESAASCLDIAHLGTDELAKVTSFGSFDALRHTSSTVVNAGLAFGPIGGGVGTTLSRTLDTIEQLSKKRGQFKEVQTALVKEAHPPCSSSLFLYCISRRPCRE